MNDFTELKDIPGDLARTIFHPAPSSGDDLEVDFCGRGPNAGVRYYLYEDVLDELAFASKYRWDPCFAVLLGHFAIDETSPFIEVTGFGGMEYLHEIEDLYSQCRPTVEQSMREAMAAHPAVAANNEHVVGLFVGLPRSEGRIHREIARTHLSLFNIPFQPVLVIDPALDKIALYIRPPRDRFYNVPFYVVRKIEGLQAEGTVAVVREAQTAIPAVPSSVEPPQDVHNPGPQTLTPAEDGDRADAEEQGAPDGDGEESLGGGDSVPEFG